MGSHPPQRRLLIEADLTIAEMLLTEASYHHAEGLGCILARRIVDTREQRETQGYASHR